MKSIGAFDAKTHFSQLLAGIQNKDEEFLIQKRGEKVAVIMSYAKFALRQSQTHRLEILEGFRALLKV